MTFTVDICISGDDLIGVEETLSEVVPIPYKSQEYVAMFQCHKRATVNKVTIFSFRFYIKLRQMCNNKISMFSKRKHLTISFMCCFCFWHRVFGLSI